MCAEEIFHKSREVETLAYELARIAGDKDQEIRLSLVLMIYVS